MVERDGEVPGHGERAGPEEDRASDAARGRERRGDEEREPDARQVEEALGEGGRHEHDGVREQDQAREQEERARGGERRAAAREPGERGEAGERERAEQHPRLGARGEGDLRAAVLRAQPEREEQRAEPAADEVEAEQHPPAGARLDRGVVERVRRRANDPPEEQQPEREVEQRRGDRRREPGQARAPADPEDALRDPEQDRDEDRELVGEERARAGHAREREPRRRGRAPRRREREQERGQAEQRREQIRAPHDRAHRVGVRRERGEEGRAPERGRELDAETAKQEQDEQRDRCVEQHVDEVKEERPPAPELPVEREAEDRQRPVAAGDLARGPTPEVARERARGAGRRAHAAVAEDRAAVVEDEAVPERPCEGADREREERRGRESCRRGHGRMVTVSVAHEQRTCCWRAGVDEVGSASLTGPRRGWETRAMDPRAEHELSHGRRLAAGDPEATWGWGSAAGRARARRRAALIAEAAGLRPGLRVLELGCGAGLFSELFAAHGVELVATDLSPELLAHARARGLARVRFVERRVEEWSEGPFDAVVGSSILHHLDLALALPRLHAALRPGGAAAFAEPNLLNPQVYLERRLRRLPWFSYVTPDETAFVRWSLRRALVDAGFVDVTVEPFDWLHPAVPAPLVGAVALLGGVLERVPLLREWSGSLLIRARRRCG